MKSMKWLASNIVVVLILMVTDVSAAPQTLDKVVAVVDDDVVMASELGLQMHMIEAQLQQANKPIPPLEVMQKQVLEKLIVESLQVQLGERAGIKVTDEQLQAALVDIAAQNRVSIDALQQEVESRAFLSACFVIMSAKKLLFSKFSKQL